MTTYLFAIASHTPSWVWVMLAILVSIGLRQTQTRNVTAVRVLIVPAVIGVASLASVLHSFAGAGVLLTATAWLVGAVLGFAANAPLDLPRQVSANADGSFRIGGSIAPLLLLVGIFMVRYVVNVALAIAPSLSANPDAAVIAALAYGLPAGLLAARSRKVWSSRGTTDGLLAA